MLDSLIGFPYYFGGISGWLLLNSPLTHMESMVLQQPTEMSAASSCGRHLGDAAAAEATCSWHLLPCSPQSYPQGLSIGVDAIDAVHHWVPGAVTVLYVHLGSRKTSISH